MKKVFKIFVVLVLCYTNLQDGMANAVGDEIGKLHPRLNGVSNLFATPDAPTNLVVTPINTGGMIHFTAPASDGGSPIINYEYSIDNGNNWIAQSPASNASWLIIVSSQLINCTSYQVKLRAVNSNGSGTASAAVTLTPANTSGNPGTIWTSRTSAADNGWFSVAYGNGRFVAVPSTGDMTQVMTSLDGKTWALGNPAPANSWYSVTYGNRTFVAVSLNGTNRVITSPDGINWTPRNSAAAISWFSVTYGNGKFVAVATTGAGNQVMTSPDGVIWTLSTTPIPSRNWRSVVYGNNKFVALAFGGGSATNQVMTSPDGENWSSYNAANSNNWKSIAYGNGKFVAVANDPITTASIMTSVDGENWTSIASPTPNGWLSVTFGNGLFVAVANKTSNSGPGNQVMTSPDGVNWTLRTSAVYNSWTSVIYENGLFVAVALDGTGNSRVMTSSFTPVADAPVITSTSVSETTATVSFTQSLPADAPAITNYQYSIDNGVSWTTLSPASTASPITVTGVTEFKNQIQLKAINSVGNSCPAIYSIVGINLNRNGQKSSIPSEFINKNGALGISGIRTTGESRINTPFLSATAAVTSITATTATSGGTVGADGGASVTARGVCWSTTANPTTADSKTIDGTGTGTFTSAITGLTSNTTYYVRSYATNSVGTSYGPEVIFITGTESSTPPTTPPTLSNSKGYHYVYDGTIDSSVLYSFDGTTWATVSSTTPSGNLSSSSYLGVINGKAYHYVYDGTIDSSVLYSFDGTTWATVSSSSIPGGNLGGWLSDMGGGSFIAEF